MLLTKVTDAPLLAYMSLVMNSISNLLLGASLQTRSKDWSYAHFCGICRDCKVTIALNLWFSKPLILNLKQRALSNCESELRCGYHQLILLFLAIWLCIREDKSISTFFRLISTDLQNYECFKLTRKRTRRRRLS
jgi:hypothetical protein